MNKLEPSFIAGGHVKSYHFSHLENSLAVSSSFLKYLFIWLHQVSVVVHGLSCPSACGILASLPGLEPASSTGRLILNHWTTREVSEYLFSILQGIYLAQKLLYHMVILMFKNLRTHPPNFFIAAVPFSIPISNLQGFHFLYILQFRSVAQSCLILCDPMDCSPPGFPVHHQLPEFTQTHVHWVSDAIQTSHPLPSFSSHLQSFPASGSFQMSQFFASGGQSIDWSFSFSISPSSEYSELISFRIDWFDLLAVQGTLKNLLQHHGSKA